MNNEIAKRVLEEASYILISDDTIRKTAQVFGVSKSTVHKDLKERLIDIDEEMYKEVSLILHRHALLKHIKGGEATKNKYSKGNQ